MSNYKNTKERTITLSEKASFIKEIKTANTVRLVVKDSQDKTMYLELSTQQVIKIVDNLLLFDSIIECETLLTSHDKFKCITVAIF